MSIKEFAPQFTAFHEIGHDYCGQDSDCVAGFGCSGVTNIAKCQGCRGCTVGENCYYGLTLQCKDPTGFGCWIL